MFHKDIPQADRHAIHAWTVADLAARDALTLVADDVGKVCKIDSNGAYHILVDHTLPTWADITGIGGGGGSGSRTELDADTTFYVATTGLDTNAGSAASPFLTLAAAFNHIKNNIDAKGFAVTIQIVDGTYNSDLIDVTNLPVPVTILGNLTTPANVNLVGGANGLLSLTNCATVTMQGCKVSAGAHVIKCVHSRFRFGLVEFGAAGSGGHLYLSEMSYAEPIDSFTISGNAGYFCYALNSTLYNPAKACTFVGTVTIQYYFVYSNLQSSIYWAGTFTGTFTGSRYYARNSGHISVTGGTTTFFPGSGAGGTANGGFYGAT